jgi:hypothetical protein
MTTGCGLCTNDCPGIAIAPRAPLVMLTKVGLRAGFDSLPQLGFDAVNGSAMMAWWCQLPDSWNVSESSSGYGHVRGRDEL